MTTSDDDKKPGRDVCVTGGAPPPGPPQPPGDDASAKSPAHAVLARTKPFEIFVRRAVKVLDFSNIPRTEDEARRIIRAVPSVKKIEALRKPFGASIYGATNVVAARILIGSLSGTLPMAAGCSRRDWLCATLDALEFDDDDEFRGFTAQIIASAYRQIVAEADGKSKFLPPPAEFVKANRSARKLYAAVHSQFEFFEVLRGSADRWRLDEVDDADAALPDIDDKDHHVRLADGDPDSIPF